MAFLLRALATQEGLPVCWGTPAWQPSFPFYPRAWLGDQSLDAWAQCFVPWVTVFSCHPLTLHSRALKTTPTPSRFLPWSLFWVLTTRPVLKHRVLAGCHGTSGHDTACTQKMATDGLFHGMDLFLHLSQTPSGGWHWVVSHSLFPGPAPHQPPGRGWEVFPNHGRLNVHFLCSSAPHPRMLNI